MVIRPKVVKKGSDPDCIHDEYINSETMVGTCRKCGQLRRYPDAVEIVNQEREAITLKAAMVDGQSRQQRRKTRRMRSGKIKHWVSPGPAEPAQVRTFTVPIVADRRTKPVLIKGRDF